MKKQLARISKSINKNPTRRSIKKGGWQLFLAISLIFLAGCTASPEGERRLSIVAEDTVASGQNIDNDILLTGTNVVVDGTINGDLLAIGNTITINGPVGGSVVAVGQNVTINDEIGGSLYSIAQRLELSPNALIVNNAHFAGLFLDTSPGSVIQRDLVVASLRGRLSVEIGRSLNGFILLMTLNGRIGVPAENPAGLESTPVPTEENSSIQPGFKLFGNKRVFIGATSTNLASPFSPRFIYQRIQKPASKSGLESDLEQTVPNWLFERLTELVILLPIGLITLWLFPGVVKDPARSIRGKPLAALGFGLVGAVVAVNIIAIAILLFVLLLMFGIWLGSVFSWNLSFIAWGVGYPALMLAFALFLLAVLYGGKVILADLVGRLIFEKLAPPVTRYRILPFLLGVTLYILLRAIPSVGFALEVIVTILGLGGIWLALRDYRRKTGMIGTELPSTGILEE